MELSNRKALLIRAKEIMDNESVNPLEALKMAEKEFYKEELKIEGEDL